MTASADDITVSLVQLARDGDQAAFADLVVRHRPVALRLCKKRARRFLRQSRSIAIAAQMQLHQMP